MQDSEGSRDGEEENDDSAAAGVENDANVRATDMSSTAPRQGGGGGDFMGETRVEQRVSVITFGVVDCTNNMPERNVTQYGQIDCL
jgi:hypothetical protein